MIKKIILLGLLASLLLNVESIIADTNTVIFKKGSYLINYRLTPLDNIFKAIENNFHITIIGLNSRRSEIVSLSINAESLEAILKKLIKSIEEKSYAFIYVAGKLTRLYFIPESGTGFIYSKKKAKTDSHTKNCYGARITSVFYDSYMPSAELKIGDIITEYDNVKITRGPMELSELMKKRSGHDSIEMRILRGNVPMSIFVTGGLINAGLKTIALGDMNL